MIGYRCNVPNGVSDEMVHDWAKELGYRVVGGSAVYNPHTFEPERTWFFENEEVKLLFLLKWSNT